MAFQRDATAIYIVDAEISEAPLQYGLPARIQIERLRGRGGPVIESETLEDLCAALEDWGVNGAGAIFTLQEYNHALRQGQAGRLATALTTGRPAGRGAAICARSGQRAVKP